MHTLPTTHSENIICFNLIWLIKACITKWMLLKGVFSHMSEVFQLKQNHHMQKIHKITHLMIYKGVFT